MQCEHLRAVVQKLQNEWTMNLCSTIEIRLNGIMSHDIMPMRQMKIYNVSLDLTQTAHIHRSAHYGIPRRAGITHVLRIIHKRLHL